ncbi:Vacuolar fusion protein mon1 [Tulasnella sp. 418]|nr:Vacuolar fusion protein mon1 [Tulasnella sp. 418]
MGIMQALISVYADDGDKIRCINAGRTKISFLLRAPLYYVCVSSWGEPESVVRLESLFLSYQPAEYHELQIRHHLEYLHLQILSVITGSQLSSIFQRRTNFDLRRLLDGTEGLLYSLIRRMEGVGFPDEEKTNRRTMATGESGGFGMGMMMAALEAVRMDSGIRSKVGDALVPSKDMKDTLYVLLVAGTKVITLLRPKKHSVHPADLHLLINTLSSSSLSSTPASSSWLPICLPKFNPNGFLHTYVSFLGEQRSNASAASKSQEVIGPSTPPITESDPPGESTTQIGAEAHDAPSTESTIDAIDTNSAEQPDEASQNKQREATVALTIVTAEREGFERLRNWAGTVVENLESSGLLRSIFTATRQHEYTTSELGVPGLRHFVYKSRKHVQLTMPIWEDPYSGLDDQRRLVTLYQILHDAVHARSGQPGGPLKLQYIRTEKESVMCWVTTPFELYVALSPLLPKSAAVSAANSLTRWVQKEEERLFLRDAPVF